MLQVTLERPGRFIADTVEPPKPPPGHALVHPRAIGVCGTDLHAFAGRQAFFTYPRVIGHELGVEVLSLPPGDHIVKVGDRCAVEPYIHCGTCNACRLGKTNCCESLQVLGVHIDGGMRGQFAVPVKYLHRSDSLSYEQLALIETLSIGQHAIERSGLQRGESALIIGAGPIGLAVTQFALAAGAAVRVLDVNPTRRAFVARWGVETIGETDGRLADVVFDATGNANSMEASFAYVAFGGRLVFVGIVLDKVPLDDVVFHRREMTLFATRNSAGAFPTILKQVESGAIDTSAWVTHRMKLRDVPTQFLQLPTMPGLVKAIVEVDDADA